MRRLLPLALLLMVVAIVIVGACAKKHKSEEKPLNCTGALTTWYNTCGFSVSLDGVDPVSYDDALASCKDGGHLWKVFVRCYMYNYKKNNNSCEVFAGCAPEHAFGGDDDTADDDAIDDDIIDDDTVDDDAVDDDTIDDDATDDDTL